MAAQTRNISFNEYTWQVLQDAAELWPEHGDNFSALVCKVIVEWSRQRDGGGKTTKIIERLETAEQRIIEKIAAARRAGCDSVDEFDDAGMEINAGLHG